MNLSFWRPQPIAYLCCGVLYRGVLTEKQLLRPGCCSDNPHVLNMYSLAAFGVCRPTIWRESDRRYAVLLLLLGNPKKTTYGSDTACYISHRSCVMCTTPAPTVVAIVFYVCLLLWRYLLQALATAPSNVYFCTVVVAVQSWTIPARDSGTRVWNCLKLGSSNHTR